MISCILSGVGSDIIIGHMSVLPLPVIPSSLSVLLEQADELTRSGQFSLSPALPQPSTPAALTVRGLRVASSLVLTAPTCHLSDFRFLLLPGRLCWLCP